MAAYSILVLVFAALTGLLLATKVLKEQFAPWLLSLLHALFGATALVLLGIPLLDGTSSQMLTLATGVLVAAALGGFFLASFHLRRKIPPRGVVFVHAGVAVIGFLLVLLGVLGAATGGI